MSQASRTRNISALHDTVGNRNKLTYPRAKNIVYTFDALNRASKISDGANARAVYNYIGPSRRSQVALKNGGSTVSTYKLLHNGVAQITSALYRNAADTATIIGYEHDCDKVGNPEYEIRVHQSSEGDAYMYDNLYRVTRTIYDDADPTSPTYASARRTAGRPNSFAPSRNCDACPSCRRLHSFESSRLNDSRGDALSTYRKTRPSMVRRTRPRRPCCKVMHGRAKTTRGASERFSVFDSTIGVLELIIRKFTASPQDHRKGTPDVAST